MVPSAQPPPADETVRAWCPGRVTLIGDHTDYSEGVSLTMAVDLGTEVAVAAEAGATVLAVTSDAADGEAGIDLDMALDPEILRAWRPAWSRYVAAVVAIVRPPDGGQVWVRSTLPVGAGLSSSAALTVAAALAFGLQTDPLTAARTCQRAEQAATGVEVGLLDPWTATTAAAGAATLLDFAAMSAQRVPMPAGTEVVVVHSGRERSLHRSAYQARRAECDAAAYRLGPLGHVDPEAVLGLPDPVLRRRARHVVTECDRVRWFVQALQAGDLAEAGRLMLASHRSLAGDFEVSTPELDALVATLVEIPGVHGARLTGAGFGGCVVALTEPGAVDVASLPTPAWRVRSADGAQLVEVDGPDLRSA